MDKDLNGLNEEREEKAVPEAAENAAEQATQENEARDGGNGKGNKPRKPLEKKTLIRIISISAAAVVAAVSLILGLVLGLKGCKNNGEYTVTLEASDHVLYNYTPANYLPDGEEGGAVEQSVPSATVTVKHGEVFKFTLTVEEGYTQLPTVSANSTKLTPADGVYSFEVTGNVTVTVRDVVEVSYVLDGSGTQSSPYSLKSLADLNFLADMINAGTVSYVQAYYSLDSDIDCGGERLKVIGDGSGVNSFFGGYFEGNNHTISNYETVTNGAEYVGLFGFAQASTSNSDYGVIRNVHLKDFTITAVAAQGRNVMVGSIVGCGIATKVINCSAVNGSINVFGNNYFCYAGGAIGIQQSVTASSGSTIYPFCAIAEGVHTDVDIFTGAGFTYAAGGITGMLYSDDEVAPSTISNSYSAGGVYGAMRAGGIAGFVTDYCTINNTYSTGEIAARSDMDNLNVDFAAEYGAYAGGIAGYCGFNTLIANSFSTAKTSASKLTETTVAVTGGIAAYTTPDGIATYATVIYNCYSGTDARGTDANFVKNTLNWNATQWNAADGSLPTLTGAAAGNVTVTLNFGGKTVGSAGNQSATLKNESGYFASIGEAYRTGDLPDAVSATDGTTSYGYYFDSNCEHRVPDGFVPMGDITLYAGFADYNEVSGAYYYNRNGRTVVLTLENDGIYTYEDGFGYISYYTYDGDKIYFFDGLFARLSQTVTEEGAAANFNAYRFVATKTANGLKLYDGVYFTESEPLELSSTAPTVTGDAFKGKWEKSSTILETYEFDGNGSWNYAHNGVTRSGSYTINNGVATLKLSGSDSVYATAEIDGSGLILIKLDGEKEGTLYSLYGSMFGVWFDENSGDYVRFEGYGSSLAGDVIASIDGTPYALTYVNDNYCIEADGGVCFTVLNDSSYFGYLVYYANDRTLTGELYRAATGGYARYTFYLVDNYSGEWIGEGNIDGVDFRLVNFNGFGTYEIENEYGLTENLGYIEINGERVPYTVSIENALKGTFTYKGNEYTLSYDESGLVTITGDSGTASLWRKDGMYSYSFIDADNNRYSFNGGGNLSGGGVLTVTDRDGKVISEYGYTLNDGNLFPDKSIVVTLKDRVSGETVGTMSASNDNKMLFALNGKTAERLDLYTPFTGVWAIAGNRMNFSINNFDLSLTARGGFQTMSSVTYKLDVTNNYITLTYMDDLTSYTVYVLYIDDGDLAISSYPYLVAGDYVYAARQDEMFGDWTNTAQSGRQLRFDGMGDSRYVYGTAWDTGTLTTYNYTRRFGKIYMWLANDDTEVFVLNAVDYQKVGENVFAGTTRVAYELTEFEEVTTPVCTAKDGETEYKFYFDGSLERDGRNGTYELIEMNGNVTRLVIHVVGEDDVTAEVNHINGTVTII